MPDPIIFYDIHNTAATAEARAWSPNTWKTRYSLGFKGLPFKTVWVEYPDIAALYKRLGATATSTNPDGSPYYTLPIIQDPSTGAVVSDSWKIAEYLDATYPGTPRLLPAGTATLQSAFQAAIWSAATQHLADLMQGPTSRLLTPRSEDFFRNTRDVEGRSTRRDERWEAAEAGFKRIAAWFDKNGEGSRWVMGDTVTFADFALASWIIWVRQVDGHGDWQKVKAWDGGRWVRYVDGLSKYAVFDQGQLY
ncbi:hypothetical protein PUNSTDRAFT_97823 [Punctularia strigosozonata HHB-11173 SS5]|uniref:uncharacterized protein n=1 Tax=Punctularia strigosozonata (strain HHB-11173) TaxID=741275 RepID=UPI0004417A47|nr:uncharacterized protein PUNSTDRAFT_97823 [Punctularia strigosozonata HHB-11173 SS5]EIN12879.1 hypothetical protein PUNSTDRAFT_97823 [Punctularia strigosozonata HHB-11173 SS5]